MSTRSLPWLVLLVLLGCHDRDVPPGYQGVVELEQRHLGFELASRIADVAVARGQLVAAGEVLARLDDSLERPARDARAAELATARAQAELLHAGSRPEDIRAAAAQLAGARATVSQIETNLRRQRQLAGAGVATAALVEDLQSQLERARAEVRAQAQRLAVVRKGARAEDIAAADARVDAARAALAAADLRLERYMLHSPIDGAVVDVVLRGGEVAAAGAPVVIVADTSHPYVDVFVPQGELGGVRVGAPARVRVDSVDAELTGRVEDVAREAEFTPRFLFSQQERPNLVIRVRVRVDDPGRRLHAGAPAFVELGRSAQ